MKVWLRVTNGPSKGMEIPVKAAKFLIGRGKDCHLRPASKLVSKRHCLIESGEAALVLRDLNSTNGTFVNEHELKGACQVSDGDEVRIGPLSFVITTDSAVEDIPPPPPPAPAEDIPAPPPAAAAAVADFEPEDDEDELIDFAPVPSAPEPGPEVPEIAEAVEEDDDDDDIMDQDMEATSEDSIISGWLTEDEQEAAEWEEEFAEEETVRSEAEDTPEEEVDPFAEGEDFDPFEEEGEEFDPFSDEDPFSDDAGFADESDPFDDELSSFETTEGPIDNEPKKKKKR